MCDFHPSTYEILEVNILLSNNLLKPHYPVGHPKEENIVMSGNHLITFLAFALSVFQPTLSLTLKPLSTLVKRSGGVEFDPKLPKANIIPTALDRSSWTVTADSSMPGSDPNNVMDTKAWTWWESAQTQSLPQSQTIDMHNAFILNGFSYLPRQDGTTKGNVGDHTIEVSLDGNAWQLVSSGTYSSDATRKISSFTNVPARYVRFNAKSEVSGLKYVAVAEINVYSAPDPTLPRDQWVVTADSEAGQHAATEAIDGSSTTYWSTQLDGKTARGFPHTFTIDQGESVAVSGLSYLPQPDGGSAKGRIGRYSVEKSDDGRTWTFVTEGTWADNTNPKFCQFSSISTRYFRLNAKSEAGNRGPWTSAAEINLLDGTKQYSAFVAMADSEETAAEDGSADNALDGDISSIWITAWDKPNPPKYPHTFTIDLQTTFDLHGLNYTPRQDQVVPQGNIGEHRIEVSLDNEKWTPVATGTWRDDKTSKVTQWDGATARYIRLTALTEAGNRGPWASAAEIHPLISTSYTPPPPSQGRWGEVIEFPLVPVLIALVPGQGKILAWSSYAPDSYAQDKRGQTVTATYDPATGFVTQETVTNTHHDMFCPGLSYTTVGAILVAGGDNAQATSSYWSDRWSAAAPLHIPRGYNSQVTLSSGGIFTIGGSWSGPKVEKNGEAYNPASNEWTYLPDCKVKPMLTNDRQDTNGVYRGDNHGWLFARENQTIFQAGPSRNMNWYTIKGTGSTHPAGTRADDEDSMNGNAVMYDAVEGMILTVGGATSYDASPASKRAHIIKLGAALEVPSVERIGDMNYARAFANSVVLPSGHVLIFGGLTYARVFNDDTSVLYPEMFDPQTRKFTKLARMTIPRNYHSACILMPDANVFCGGGGLCGTGCEVNHFDAQIFTPPYLLDDAGKPAVRPNVTHSPDRVPIGSIITVRVDREVSAFALMRAAGATHSINTDQRRVPLKMTKLTGSNNDSVEYKVEVPDNPGAVIPGWWMLFAIGEDGVPSEGPRMYCY